MLRVSRNACFRGSSWSRILSSTTPPRAALRERPRRARRSWVASRAEQRRSATSLGSRRFALRLFFVVAAGSQRLRSSPPPSARRPRRRVCHDRSSSSPAPRRRERRSRPRGVSGAPRMARRRGCSRRRRHRPGHAPPGRGAHGSSAGAACAGGVACRSRLRRAVRGGSPRPLARDRAPRAPRGSRARASRAKLRGARRSPSGAPRLVADLGCGACAAPRTRRRRGVWAGPS